MRAFLVILRGLELGQELRYCLDVLLDEYEHAKSQVRRVKKELNQLARSDRHQATVSVLKTVPGVGLITTLTFRTELLEPARFNDSRQVARMMGLAPQISESGETRREGRLLKSGNSRLRTVLVEGAWRWVSRDPKAAERYRRLVANTGNAKKAIIGMARRLGILLWRLSVRLEPYKEVT
jgi:transposase